MYEQLYTDVSKNMQMCMLGESSNRGQLRAEEGDYQNIRLFHPLPLNINTAERNRRKREDTSNTDTHTHTQNHDFSFVFS